MKHKDHAQKRQLKGGGRREAGQEDHRMTSETEVALRAAAQKLKNEAKKDFFTSLNMINPQ